MVEQDKIFKNIINIQALYSSNIIIALVTGDGSCLYRALALYLANNEINYKTIRELYIMLLLKIKNLFTFTF